MPRTALVNVDASILSSYGPGGTAITIPRSQLKSLVSINVGKMPSDAAAALLALHKAVLAAGGDFRVTDCFRSTATQAEARAKYDNWVKAGKPAPGSGGWNSATMKNAFVSPPGRSNHNAGRAIDVHVDALRFPGVSADKQLDRLWELAIPLGWSPVIKEAKEGASESWHFDFHGFWKPVLARAGYESAAIAAAHDVGNGESGGSGSWQNVQGQLHRAGFDCGIVDGAPGSKTFSALAASGYKGDHKDVLAATKHVEALPNAVV